jgi:hypothetical protein
MSVSIIVRKHSTSRRFHPHYNSALGKYIHTKEDYLREMKSGGFEPYDPNVKEKGIKKHQMSPWVREVTNSIKEHTKRGKFEPSGRLINEMKRRGCLYTKQQMADYAALPSHYQTDKGGFADDSPKTKRSKETKR